MEIGTVQKNVFEQDVEITDLGDSMLDAGCEFLSHLRQNGFVGDNDAIRISIKSSATIDPLEINKVAARYPELIFDVSMSMPYAYAVRIGVQS
ncbi:MAG: hypothetical protein V3V00_15830 [Saprospiraceae bacterium]